MPQRPGIAVIGAGMAGRAHASARRTAPTVGTGELPDVELTSVCDISGSLAAAAENAESIARLDFTVRRTPGLAAIRDFINNGTTKEIAA